MTRLRIALGLASSGVALLLLGACSSGESPISGGPAPGPIVTPAPTPAPTPTPTPASFNVQRCFEQQFVPGSPVFTLVVPDVLSLNLRQPAGFPNGRRLEDPVVDLILAAIFLDLSRHPVDAFARIPLNPGGNDRPFRTQFPYLAPAQGNPPLPTPGGTNFNFRSDPPTSYVIVERGAFPALATALVSGPQRVPFNEGNPADDATGRWIPEFRAGLVGLTNILADDLQLLNLNMCATPS